MKKVIGTIVNTETKIPIVDGMFWDYINLYKVKIFYHVMFYIILINFFTVQMVNEKMVKINGIVKEILTIFLYFFNVI